MQIEIFICKCTSAAGGMTVLQPYQGTNQGKALTNNINTQTQTQCLMHNLLERCR